MVKDKRNLVTDSEAEKREARYSVTRILPVRRKMSIDSKLIESEKNLNSFKRSMSVEMRRDSLKNQNVSRRCSVTKIFQINQNASNNEKRREKININIEIEKAKREILKRKRSVDILAPRLQQTVIIEQKSNYLNAERSELETFDQMKNKRKENNLEKQNYLKEKKESEIRDNQINEKIFKKQRDKEIKYEKNNNLKMELEMNSNIEENIDDKLKKKDITKTIEEWLQEHDIPKKIEIKEKNESLIETEKKEVEDLKLLSEVEINKTKSKAKKVKIYLI